MSKPEEIQYDFNKPISTMLEQAGVVKEFADQDIDDLKVFDEELDEDYITGFGESITRAKAIPLDEIVMDMQAGKSAVVLATRKICEDHFADIKYFVNKAFPKDTAIKNEFGYNDYEEVRTKPAMFVPFLRQLNITVNKYAQQLRDKGMPAALLTISATLAGKLEKDARDHEISMKGRTLTTQDRRIAYNEVWNMMKQFCLAGKRVYKTNYAKYRRYILYEGTQTPPPIIEEYESLPAATTATADVEFTNESVLLFKNPGVTELLICRHNIENQPNGEVGFILTASAEVVKEILEVPGTGNFINVTNLSTTDSGLFLVQLAE